ncbi:hypothetical protein WMF26_15060 [Sorangium sp. So ce185]|uniref:hypothetical protein n=1 Tax=Sorangium sp. So ce185 TaxID=3133287 RepID=UPI003F61D2CD
MAGSSLTNPSTGLSGGSHGGFGRIARPAPHAAQTQPPCGARRIGRLQRGHGGASWPRSHSTCGPGGGPPSPHSGPCRRYPGANCTTSFSTPRSASSQADGGSADSMRQLEQRHRSASVLTAIGALQWGHGLRSSMPANSTVAVLILSWVDGALGRVA